MTTVTRKVRAGFALCYQQRVYSGDHGECITGDADELQRMFGSRLEAPAGEPIPDPDPGEPTADDQARKELAALDRPELLAKAKGLGLKAGKMKNDAVIDAILEAQAKAAAAGDPEDDNTDDSDPDPGEPPGDDEE